MSNNEMLFKLIIVGSLGTGKTSILNRFIENKFFSDCPHTIGVEFETKLLNIGKDRVKVQFWDTAGQERFWAITRSYFRGAVCSILVYDVSRRKSFNQLNTWLSDTRNLTNPNSVTMVIGNKTDLKEREVSREEGEEFAQENDFIFFETSAKTGENVRDSIMYCIKKVHQLVIEGKLKLTNTETQKELIGESREKSGCC
ncbi:ras-related protein rab-4a [Anaeramoeba flamelloides]|uniref:Ras-related protein rab-4a n=1 Tax=Anaeramoeba flamelloides TaxID=1746091 RepID=A0AAV8A8G2_9EUKA|nr:ras-related protein rab-4a [Anaeramoeba flamelloides]KAJ6251040.1 ras-related protein rab-4a [Anaeramoeba flamelloides]